MDKSLLTEKIFPERNFVYKPPINLNISIPTSPKVTQFPSRTLGQPFIDKNIMVGQPTPMDRFLEPMRSPIGAMGLVPWDLMYIMWIWDMKIIL